MSIMARKGKCMHCGHDWGSDPIDEMLKRHQQNAAEEETYVRKWTGEKYEYVVKLAAPQSQDALDAARYRWLRESVGNDERLDRLNDIDATPDTPEKFDAAIDAAMGRKS